MSTRRKFRKLPPLSAASAWTRGIGVTGVLASSSPCADAVAHVGGPADLGKTRACAQEANLYKARKNVWVISAFVFCEEFRR